MAAIAAAAWLACGLPAAAQPPTVPEVPGSQSSQSGFKPRPVREGTFSLGGQAQYGTLFATTGYGRDYDAGPGMAIRLRYRTGRESAVGFSFEGQRFDAAEEPVSDLDPEWIRGVVTTFEYYQFFRVRKRSPRYLVGGVGLVQMRRQLKDGETDFPGDGGVLTLGGGTEFWLKRWVTLDLSLRYYCYARGGDGGVDLSHNVQAAAGLQFYTSP